MKLEGGLMKMDFLNAVREIKKGKKVRRKSWDMRYGIGVNDCTLLLSGFINNKIGLNELILYTNDFEATDWEIYEEQEKTLTDEVKEYWRDNAYPKLSKFFEILRNHNQKIKEDIDKLMDDDVLKSYKIIKIIDKRAGKLE